MQTIDLGSGGKIRVSSLPLLDQNGNEIVVYGGRVDVVNGVLTAKKNAFLLDGSGFDVSTILNIIDRGSYVSFEYYPARAAVKPQTEYLSDLFDYAGESHSDAYQIVSGTSDKYAQLILTLPSEYNTVSAIAGWFQEHPSTIVYELLREKTYQLNKDVLRTFLNGNAVWSDAGNVECGYSQNTASAIGNVEERLDENEVNDIAEKAMIASIEPSSTATQTYETDDLIILDSILYKATRVITGGETLVPGINIEQTTIADILKQTDSDIDEVQNDVGVLQEDVINLNRQISDETTGLDTKAPVIINTASGAIASFDDGADSMPIKSLVAQIEPVQDLHGYDSPWPAGGGTNIFNPTEYFPDRTASGLASEIQTDGTIHISGTATAANRYGTSSINILPAGTYVVTGTPQRVTARDSSGDISSNGVFTSDGETPISFCVKVTNGTAYDFYEKIQLNAGTTANEWSPYENICPISGWTGAEIGQSEKNLWDGSVSFVQGTFNQAENLWGGFLPSTTRIRTVPFKFFAGTFTISNTSGFDVVMYFYDLDGTGRDVETYWDWASSPRTVVIPEDCMIAIGLRKSDNATITPDELTGFQVELGSTATYYEPYTGDQISVTFPTEAGTVYGGTLTLNPDRTGTLVVDRRLVTYNGTNATWYEYANYQGFFTYPARQKNGTRLKGKSNYLKVLDGTNGPVDQPLGVWIGASSISTYCIRLSSILSELTVSAWNAYLAEHNLQIEYPLATPITYHFDNVGQLFTFFGENNVWCDTGDITELIYPADTKLFLTARDEEITGNIAPIENGATASQAYAQGAYFWHDTKFCKALTAIASGATFTLGTNYQKTTVAAELLAAQN